MRNALFVGFFLIAWMAATGVHAQNEPIETESPIEQAFRSGETKAQAVCALSISKIKAQMENEKKEAYQTARKQCLADIGPKGRPAFGRPPENSYLLAVMASYFSFVALKIVSITAILVMGKKLTKDQKIAALLFSVATIVLFIILYVMSGLKPIVDYYLSYGDQGVPLIGILVYGVPAFVVTYFSFQYIWKRVVEQVEHLPYIAISIFITVVNIESVLAVDHIGDNEVETVYPIHLVYLAILLAMLIFFGFKYNHGFLQNVEDHGKRQLEHSERF